MAQRVKGICYLKIDGTQLSIKADSSMEAPINTNAREAVMALDGLAGYGETAQRQYLKGTLVFTGDVDIQALNNMTNGTIVNEFANGKVYTLTGAYLEGENLADGIAGELPVEFTGTNGIWS
jgi:hypothetical protein